MQNSTHASQKNDTYYKSQLWLLTKDELLKLALSESAIALRLLQNRQLDEKWDESHLATIEKYYGSGLLAKDILHQISLIRHLKGTITPKLYAQTFDAARKRVTLSEKVTPPPLQHLSPISPIESYDAEPRYKRPQYPRLVTSLHNFKMFRNLSGKRKLTLFLLLLLGISGVVLILSGIGAMLGASFLLGIMSSINIVNLSAILLGASLIVAGLGALALSAWGLTKERISQLKSKSFTSYATAPQEIDSTYDFFNEQLEFDDEVYVAPTSNTQVTLQHYISPIKNSPKAVVKSLKEGGETMRCRSI